MLKDIIEFCYFASLLIIVGGNLVIIKCYISRRNLECAMSWRKLLIPVYLVTSICEVYSGSSLFLVWLLFMLVNLAVLLFKRK